MIWMDAGIAGGATIPPAQFNGRSRQRPREERCPQTRRRNAIACPDPTDTPKNRAPFPMFETVGDVRLGNLNHIFLYW